MHTIRAITITVLPVVLSSLCLRKLSSNIFFFSEIWEVLGLRQVFLLMSSTPSHPFFLHIGQVCTWLAIFVFFSNIGFLWIVQKRAS